MTTETLDQVDPDAWPEGTVCVVFSSATWPNGMTSVAVGGIVAVRMSTACPMAPYETWVAHNVPPERKDVTFWAGSEGHCAFLQAHEAEWGVYYTPADWRPR